jgi:uncharacterized protein YecE (DUF72 family)
MKYNIGCSGFYYPEWKNKFYPAELAQKNWLTFYSSIFNTVELNGTFYRQPKLHALKKNAASTPEDFTFSVKMSRYITHVNRLKDEQLIHNFQNLIKEGLGTKLAYFLFQMPSSFKYSDENLERIIKNVPHSLMNVVEFRHISWWNATVEEAFRTYGITFCNVDYPGLESFFISPSKTFYLRLHGNPELFVSKYSLAGLKRFIKQFPQDASSYTIYFNNTAREGGYTNATQLAGLLSKTSKKKTD